MKYLKPIQATVRGLPTRMILGVVALVLLTATAAGLPALWLLRNQLERQAWAQVEQGSRATQALYTARQNELVNLATLTAQRPTLRDLLERVDVDSLPPYLQTLREGAALDALLICDSAQQLVASSGDVPASLCDIPAGQTALVEFLPVADGVEGWLLAAHPLEADTEGRMVIVGTRLDDDFAEQMQTQTGLAHTLLVDRQPLASSLDDNHRLRASAQIGQKPVTLNGKPYYVRRFLLTTTDSDHALVAEVALPVADIFSARRNLVWTLGGTIIIVALVGSLLGGLLARQISLPLARLAAAATNLSKGDLSKSIVTPTKVREVAQVGWALEAARLDLKTTLSDLRREKVWTDHLLAAIVEGIITLDHRGRIIFFSRGAEQLTGWSAAEAIGHTCDEIFKPLEKDVSFDQLLPAAGGRRKIAVSLPAGRGAILAVTAANLLPSAEDESRVVIVLRDVSEEEAVHRLLGHFLANIAHEFRTPLSALAASAELLRDQALDLSPAELQELLTSLHLGVLGLQTLIDNLLESASIEAGHFRVSPRSVDLAEIIAEVKQTMQPLLLKRNQSLQLDLPPRIPPVWVDPRRTGQVFVNLLSNASKYSPDETNIIIRVEVGDNDAIIKVIDKGDGISSEYRAHLFHRFVHDRANSQGVAGQGAGLGLSVVKAIVEAQGGQVGFDDSPGEGAIFWFTLPLAKKIGSEQ